MSSTPHLHPIPTQQEALNLEVKGAIGNNNIGHSRESALRDRDLMSSLDAASTRMAMEVASRKMMMEEALGVPAAKRFLSDQDLTERYILNAGIPSAQIKISSRDGRSQIENGSLVVSMEINGTVYQGVLFAQTASHRSTRLS
jgi:hypothetical protein